jgi:hypothetical protein
MNTNTRKNPFATLAEASTFQTKPARMQPVPNNEAIERIAKTRNFPSREAPNVEAKPVRKQRRYRTGRDQRIPIKATAETATRFYNAADARNVPLGEMLRITLDALDALEKLNPNASTQ